MALGDIKWDADKPPISYNGKYYQLGVEEVENGMFVIVAEPVLGGTRLYLRRTHGSGGGKETVCLTNQK
jgi:hypothetical protein